MEQSSNINKLVGDGVNAGFVPRKSFYGAIKNNFAPASEASSQSLRFAPQWTAPEMLSTPMGLSRVLN